MKLRLSFFLYIGLITVLNTSSLQAHYYGSIDQVFTPLPIDSLCQLFDKNIEAHEALNALFRVKKIIHPISKQKKKLVSYSLFWKPQEEVNLTTIHQVKTWGNKTCSFYEKYVKPMRKSIQYYRKNEEKTVVRIYLSADLECLVTDLLRKNVEIYLMESNSIGHSPGAMWRFLALSDKEAKCVCMKDSDDEIAERKEDKINKWIQEKSSQGFYRCSSYKIKKDLKKSIYSPIQAGNFGGKYLEPIDIEKAMKGYILYHELFPDEQGEKFPIYGFDERFLKQVIYFYAAGKGQLTSLVLKDQVKKDLKKLVKSEKEYLLEKDYDFVLQRNKNAIYY
jgi:hypothetical protein